MITFDSITSYTFNVTREPNNGEFENLAIKRLPNGEFITKLFKYNITPEEKHNNSTWIFTTIEVPYGSQGYDGEHPVSGNREFGIFQNPDGSYTFYARGVDRITDFFDSSWAENITSNPFENPDLLWGSLTEKVSNYVQNNGGNAVTPISIDNKKWRPNWNKVKQYLNGQIPLSGLGCN